LSVCLKLLAFVELVVQSCNNKLQNELTKDLMNNTVVFNRNNCELFVVSGWRLRKQFFLIKPTDPTKKDIRNILTWV